MYKVHKGGGKGGRVSLYTKGGVPIINVEIPDISFIPFFSFAIEFYIYETDFTVQNILLQFFLAKIIHSLCAGGVLILPPPAVPLMVNILSIYRPQRSCCPNNAPIKGRVKSLKCILLINEYNE